MPVHDWTRVEAGIFHDFHDVPLEPTYQAAYRGVPAFWRAALEAS